MDSSDNTNNNQEVVVGGVEPPKSAPLDTPDAASSFTPPPVPAPVPTPAPSSRKKKLLLGGMILVIVAALGVGGFTFWPNRPGNVWKTGLNRSGEAFDKMILASTEKDKLELFKKSEFTATIDLKQADKTYAGTFGLKFDETKADSNLNFVVKQPGQPDQNATLKFLSEQAKGSLYPTSYVQLTGLKTLGVDLEQFVPGISAYDGKWIAISEEYLKSLGGVPPSTEPATKEDVTADDVAELARAVSKTVKEYVLTADDKKAVFEQRNFAGKETVDGMKTYRYQVGINKAHGKDFCKVFVERIAATKIYKKAPMLDPQNVEESKSAGIKSCQRSMDGIKSDDTFDLWVDAKYKLIHKIRITDKDNKDAYNEIGQVYKGGDAVSLFVAAYDKKAQAEGKLTLDTDLKTNKTKGTLTYKSTNPDELLDLKMSLEAKPFTGDLKIEAPAGAVPIKEVLEKLGIDPSMLLMPGMLSGGGASDDELRGPGYLQN